MKPDLHVLPKWAPRIKKERIGRLYQSVGRGIIDDEMINDVGFSLLARCMSILEATDASRGKAKCPICESLVLHKCQKEETLSCQNCGWICSWQESDSGLTARARELSMDSGAYSLRVEGHDSTYSLSQPTLITPSLPLFSKQLRPIIGPTHCHSLYWVPPLVTQYQKQERHNGFGLR